MLYSKSTKRSQTRLILWKGQTDMSVSEIVGKKVAERGIPIAELARRVGMDREVLRRSINGSRKLRADEFVRVCAELDLTLEDFQAVPA